MSKKTKNTKMTYEEAVKLAKYKVKISKATVKGHNECPIWAPKKMSINIQIIERLLDLAHKFQYDGGCQVSDFRCGSCDSCKLYQLKIKD